ncbi:MAG TPA: hypothetical protein VMU08_02855 [Rhizomicrobium sp.]|nr:hypothetical protein [Rhizomicrobium sp.]
MNIPAIDPHERLRTIGKVIVTIVGFLAVLWGGLWIYALSGFLHAPLHRDVGAGFVVPWSDHGVIHYVQRADYALNDKLTLMGPFLVLAGFVGLFLYRGLRMFDRR